MIFRLKPEATTGNSCGFRLQAEIPAHYARTRTTRARRARSAALATLANVRTYGRAARIPLAVGSYPGVSSSGLSHTTLGRAAVQDPHRVAQRLDVPDVQSVARDNHDRVSTQETLAKALARIAGDTTPMLVPPPQAYARRSSRRLSPAAARRTSVVTRSRAVENVNTSTRSVTLAMATAICRAVCAEALIERLPSTSSTNRGRVMGRRSHRGASASPPVCRLARSVRRRSKRRPRLAGLQRRESPTCSRRTSDAGRVAPLGLDAHEVGRLSTERLDRAVARAREGRRVVGLVVGRLQLCGGAVTRLEPLRLVVSRVAPREARVVRSAPGLLWPRPIRRRTCRQSSASRLRRISSRGKKNSVNARSNTGTSARALVKMGRSAWRTARSSDSSTTSSARAASCSSPGPTRNPCVRRRIPQNAARFSGRLAKGYISGAALKPTRTRSRSRGRTRRTLGSPASHPESARAPRDARASRRGPRAP